MNREKISKLIDSHREEIIEFTRSLVRIPTENTPPSGNERPAQEFLKSLFYLMGLKVDEFNPTDIKDFEVNNAFLKEDRNFKDRNDVVGIWHGTGGGKSLLLSGHIDVVPKERLEWTECEPFEGIVRDARLYGRGAIDMKGGLAASIMAVKLLKEAGVKLKGDVIVESVVDEEFAGANGTIASRLRGYNADFAIVPEPTGGMIFPACVGAIIIKITIKGTSGMPFTDKAIYNPAYGIAKVIEIVRNYEKYRNSKTKPHPLWVNSPQQRQIILTKVKAGEAKKHGQLGIPIDAWVEVVIQTFPGETEESTHKEFREYLEACIKKEDELRANPPTVEKLYRYVEPSECDINTAGVQKLKECVRWVTRKPAIILGGPFSCDLFAFKKYGNTPAVLYGPLGENIHAPNEWLDIDSLITTTKVFALMILEWCEQSL